MLDNDELCKLRRNYSSAELSKKTVDKDPFIQFSRWFKEAISAKITEPNAMILATSSKENVPSIRTVLLKALENNGFVFYTNYKSRKAMDLDNNPNASILFLWLDLERQVRITGKTEKVNIQLSEKYFNSRPINSQLGAWASEQSKIIPDRDYLENKFNEMSMRYNGKEIPLPEFWGGYSLVPSYFEFWQGRENRLHDRIVYYRRGNNWKIERLAP